MPPPPHDDMQIITPSEAKQGRKGGRVLLILLAAFVLTAIGFAIVGGRWAEPLADTNANDGAQAVDAAAFQGGEPSIPASDAPTTSTGEPTAPPTGEAPNVNAPVTAVAPSTS